MLTEFVKKQKSHLFCKLYVVWQKSVVYVIVYKKCCRLYKALK